MIGEEVEISLNILEVYMGREREDGSSICSFISYHFGVISKNSLTNPKLQRFFFSCFLLEIG